MIVLKDLLYISVDIFHQLEKDGTAEVEKTETGARQCRAEKQIWEGVKKRISEINLPCRYEAEDHYPQDIVENPQFLVRIDLIDGTCDYVRQQREIPEPFTTVISVSPLKDNLIFDDVIAGGVTDLRNGEWWVADKDKGAVMGCMPRLAGIRMIQDENPLRVKIQYQEHTPVHTTDIWRRVNGLTRFLWPQCHEVWNSGSVAMDMILVALGEADIFYNGLPSISDEGQRGHELGACYRILKEAGGYAIDMRTNEELGKSPFLFDEQTSVVMGVNKEKVDEFWSKIQENLAKAEPLLKQLWELVPSERWSLG